MRVIKYRIGLFLFYAVYHVVALSIVGLIFYLLVGINPITLYLDLISTVVNQVSFLFN